MTRYALLPLLVLGLTACGASEETSSTQPPEQAPQAATPAPASASAPPPAPAPVVTPDAGPAVEAPAPTASSDDFEAVGTEPFWAVQVRAGSLRLSRPDYAEMIVPGPKLRWAGKTRTWTTESLTVSIAPGACSDGMSDRRYSYVAEVRVGQEVLKGCAYRPGAAPSATPES